MTLSLIHIAVTIGSIVLSIGGTAYFFNRKNTKQPLTATDFVKKDQFQTRYENLKETISKLSAEQERLELSNVEMKELITRTMNRISARTSKQLKKEEELETLQELLEQSKQIEHPELEFDSPQPGKGRRIVRASQRNGFRK